MLVLTRHVSESVKIGGDVTVRILRLQSGQVKLGIDAPKSVEVHREEIYKRIREERKGEAGGGEPSGSAVAAS